MFPTFMSERKETTMIFPVGAIIATQNAVARHRREEEKRREAEKKKKKKKQENK